MKKILILGIVGLISMACGESKKQKDPELAVAPNKIRALIVDGQNNHYVWPKTTMMMKDYLEETGLFTVDIRRMDSVWLGIKYKKTGLNPIPSS